jgi:hypothetical protein
MLKCLTGSQIAHYEPQVKSCLGCLTLVDLAGSRGNLPSTTTQSEMQ